MEKLEVYLKHSDIGMNKDQYLRMIEQTGEEIDWEKCPPDMEDFPAIVHSGINIYNSLGNRIFSDVGFTGKDYTNLNFFFDLYSIDKYEIEFIVEIIQFLENRDIVASQESIKRAYDKAKSK